MMILIPAAEADLFAHGAIHVLTELAKEYGPEALRWARGQLLPWMLKHPIESIVVVVSAAVVCWLKDRFIRARRQVFHPLAAPQEEAP